MGSDKGRKNDGNKINIKLLAAFSGGCLFALCSRAIAHMTKGSPSNSNCAISFGTYKGTQYTTGGTVGQPKCLVESRFLKVQQHSVQLSANVDLIDDWLWIDYHDRINVLIEAPKTDKEEPQFLIFKQTKYALEGRNSLAIVGGIIEPGEKAEDAARREVLEETAHECSALHFLGRYRTDVNRGMGWTNTYVASDCKKLSKRQGEISKHNAEEEVGVADTERQDLQTMALSEVRKAVQEGQFLEIQWSATVALAILHYDKQADTQ